MCTQRINECNLEKHGHPLYPTFHWKKIIARQFKWPLQTKYYGNKDTKKLKFKWVQMAGWKKKMHAFLQALHLKNFNYCRNYVNQLGFLVPVLPENHNCTECKVFDEKGNPP